VQEAQGERPPREPQLDEQGRARGVGRRKTSTAVAWIWRGEGRVLVNQKPVDEYFRDIMTRWVLLGAEQQAKRCAAAAHLGRGGACGPLAPW
jgi:small subunit ribosomal protein S9